MRAGPEVFAVIRGYYALLDEGRIEDCERYFAPGATLRIGNHPPVTGWESISRAMKAGLGHPRILRIRHEVLNAWEEDGGVAIFEVSATYELTDGRTIQVPGVVIAELAGGRFLSQRIAADLSPVYS